MNSKSSEGIKFEADFFRARSIKYEDVLCGAAGSPEASFLSFPSILAFFGVFDSLVRSNVRYLPIPFIFLIILFSMMQ